MVNILLSYIEFFVNGNKCSLVVKWQFLYLSVTIQRTKMIYSAIHTILISYIWEVPEMFLISAITTITIDCSWQPFRHNSMHRYIAIKTAFRHPKVFGYLRNKCWLTDRESMKDLFNIFLENIITDLLFHSHKIAVIWVLP